MGRGWASARGKGLSGYANIADIEFSSMVKDMFKQISIIAVLLAISGCALSTDEKKIALHERSTTEGLIAVGMAPQMKIIRHLAQQDGWTVTCSGSSG